MDAEGPLTSHSDPEKRPRYLLSQKRRERASCTSCTAAPRTSAGVSTQPPRRPWTKLWNAWVPSSSPSVRLCRFSDCSPELCAEREQVTPAGASPHQHLPPRVTTRGEGAGWGENTGSTKFWSALSQDLVHQKGLLPDRPPPLAGSPGLGNWPRVTSPV